MLLCVLCVMILAGGCTSDVTRPTQRHDLTLYLPQTSISNVLANMVRAYPDLDYDRYRDLFDPAFEFAFAPQDFDGPQIIPESWGLADEMQSAAHMFTRQANLDGYRVEEVHLSFTAGADVPSDLNPGWRTVVLSDINLRVISRIDAGGDRLIYDVSGDGAVLQFVRTAETAPGSGQRIWKIIRWQDEPFALRDSAVAYTTWGIIKASWR
jgi:hypothetical protein